MQNDASVQLARVRSCCALGNSRLFFSNLNHIIYLGFAIPYFYKWGRKPVFLLLKLDPSLTIYSITGSRPHFHFFMHLLSCSRALARRMHIFKITTTTPPYTPSQLLKIRQCTFSDFVNTFQHIKIHSRTKKYQFED